MSGTDLYHIWNAIKQRCKNPNNPAYHNYGLRGISYDPTWKEFNKFYNDMSPGYQKGLSIDRIDNDKGYSKENCRWSDRITQANNRRTCRIIEFNGKSMNMKQTALYYGIEPYALRNRLRRGWSIEDAINIPIGKPSIHCRK